MPDALFDDPRLAALYDPLDPDRADLDHYDDMVDEFGARSVLDVGCGTGTFACRLAARGIAVTGVDPAGGALAVARRKPSADRVRWVLGTVADLPALSVDMATMTGNVAQVFLDDDEWLATLGGVRHTLRPGGHLVFESRVPADRAWRRWDRAHARTHARVPGVGWVESWPEVTDVSDALVSFRVLFVLDGDAAPLISESTLRFRSVAEVEDSLAAVDLSLQEIREAPDRPGREHVYVAVRRD